MLPHIGIITAHNSMERIAQIDEEMRRTCKVTYLPYTTLASLATTYRENAHRFDAFVFSGRFNYTYIINHVGNIIKPYIIFELTDRDYYKAFTRLYFTRPGLDIRRVLMERPTAQVDFSDVFGDASPGFFDIDAESASSVATAYERVKEQALSMWHAGEIDCVITRFTNLEQNLRDEGIPYEILFPSRLSMLEMFNTLLTQLQSQALEDARAVFGLVRRAKGCGLSMERLEDALEEFNAMNGTTLVIRPGEEEIELATSNEVLLDITQGYTNCLLSLYLHEQLGEDAVCVGWGVGQDVVTAYRHAELATRSSMSDPGHRAFLINRNAERIGPLVSGRSVILQTMPAAGMVRLSRRMGISQLNLQRLIALRDKRKTVLFRSADLALDMNITPRSANRILGKLVQFGCATVAHSSQPVTRGRPGYVYAVDFDKLIGMLEP